MSVQHPFACVSEVTINVYKRIEVISIIRPKSNRFVAGIIIFVKVYVYCLKMVRLNRNMSQ
jgi:hypothetical protein